ncbi:hypothetical protein DLREEDagr8_43600 [Dongia sp. agr-C8]
MSPARIAGKAEAQPITVRVRARMGIQSNLRGKGRASEPRDIGYSFYVPEICAKVSCLTIDRIDAEL